MPAEVLKIKQKLGTGGFANVYSATISEGTVKEEAEQQHVEIEAAVKVVNRDSAAAEWKFAMQSLLHEWQVLSHCQHKNILRSHGITILPNEVPRGALKDVPSNTVGLMLEFCSGGTLLSQVLKCQTGRGCYTFREAMAWSLDVAAAIAFLHSRAIPVIHRDIKLENILLQYDPELKRNVAKLCDFGLCAYIEQNGTAHVASRLEVAPPNAGLSRTQTALQRLMASDAAIRQDPLPPIPSGLAPSATLDSKAHSSRPLSLAPGREGETNGRGDHDSSSVPLSVPVVRRFGGLRRSATAAAHHAYQSPTMVVDMRTKVLHAVKSLMSSAEHRGAADQSIAARARAGGAAAQPAQRPELSRDTGDASSGDGAAELDGTRQGTRPLSSSTPSTQRSESVLPSSRGPSEAALGARSFDSDRQPAQAAAAAARGSVGTGPGRPAPQSERDQSDVQTTPYGSSHQASPHLSMPPLALPQRVAESDATPGSPLQSRDTMTAPFVEAINQASGETRTERDVDSGSGPPAERAMNGKLLTFDPNVLDAKNTVGHPHRVSFRLGDAVYSGGASTVTLLSPAPHPLAPTPRDQQQTFLRHEGAPTSHSASVSAPLSDPYAHPLLPTPRITSLPVHNAPAGRGGPGGASDAEADVPAQPHTVARVLTEERQKVACMADIWKGIASGSTGSNRLTPAQSAGPNAADPSNGRDGTDTFAEVLYSDIVRRASSQAVLPVSVSVSTLQTSSGSFFERAKQRVRAGVNTRRKLRPSANRSKWKLTGETGSLAYMAPEVIGCNPYNAKIDVFSLSVLIWELFARCSITAGMYSVRQLHAWAADVLQRTVRKPFPKHFPPELREILEAGWAQDPADRPTADALLDALREFAASEAAEALYARDPKPFNLCGCMKAQ